MFKEKIKMNPIDLELENKLIFEQQSEINTVEKGSTHKANLNQRSYFSTKEEKESMVNEYLATTPIQKAVIC